MMTSKPLVLLPLVLVVPFARCSEAQGADTNWIGYYKGAEKNAGVQWRDEIFPKLKAAGVDFAHVLELAAGGGRFTEILRHISGVVDAVDNNQVGVQTLLRPRFANASNVRVHLNDGSSLQPMIRDASVSLVFSMDAMVHFAPTDIAKYVAEFARVLRPGGYAFFHHAHMRECSRAAPWHDECYFRPASWCRSTPNAKCTRGFTCSRDGTFVRGIYNGSRSCGVPNLARKNPHARNLMTCERVGELAAANGLTVVRQWKYVHGPEKEKAMLAPWMMSGRSGWPAGTTTEGQRAILDCISLLGRCTGNANVSANYSSACVSSSSVTAGVTGSSPHDQTEMLAAIAQLGATIGRMQEQLTVLLTAMNARLMR